MNIDTFQENLELMSNSGYKLTHEQAALIENSLIILQSENKFRDIFFWGRIDGVDADYYLAFGCTKDLIKDRRFFYSLNCVDWFLLPNCDCSLMEAVKQNNEQFQGDPSYAKQVLMYPTFESDPLEGFTSSPPATVSLIEEDRLACIVNLITDESALLPRGALYLRSDTNVVYNPCFQGLKRGESSSLINYQLFRYPRMNRNYNLTKHADYNYQTDFFDTIDDLMPSDCFALSVDDRDVVLIRSLQWPGMCFHHKLRTKYHGFFYFGNGNKNLDLLFMM